MRKIRLAAIFLMFTLILASCGGANSSEELTASIEKHEMEKVSLNEEFYENNLAFSWSLFQKSAKKGAENILISPLSVATALSMASNGAAGKTAEEFLSVLGADSKEQLNACLYSWHKSLESQGDVQYQDANSIWIRELPEFEIHEKFLQENVNYYDAQIFKASFNKSTVADINRWVDKKTNGMIPEFLEHLDDEGALFLLNAIAFEGKWEKEYKEVKEQSFTTLDGKKQTAQMMLSTEWDYLENDGAIGFLRPYNDQYSFGALLPKEKEGFEQYIQSLTAREFGDLISDPQYGIVNAALPKFKSEYSVEFGEILSEMGISSAFSAEQADFSEMTQIPLYISRVFHRTAIEVNEQGTKASAATGLGMNGGSSSAEIKQVILDRPFLYFILDTTTNLPIFIGTVTSIK